MKIVLFMSILSLISISLFFFLYKSDILKRVKDSVEESSVFLKVDPKEIVQYINDDRDIFLKYEQIENEEYIQRRFVNNAKDEKDTISGRKLIMGRGSWRATQGNIYSLIMFEKDIADEFSKRL